MNILPGRSYNNLRFCTLNNFNKPSYSLRIEERSVFVFGGFSVNCKLRLILFSVLHSIKVKENVFYHHGFVRSVKIIIKNSEIRVSGTIF